ncbi:Dps family protein [Bacillus sp. V5-8f]|uniref:Dps family protein n=1 Tax=Bacillus sp. V5-8f TaxID=2053044 RepID=UPI000C7850F9|nr:Dps family protein [Bacillus sp. V5-8f]PLT33518.1 DNA starvation/stationary phase protection protein [Bacillus sp. V5-8f]
MTLKDSLNKQIANWSVLYFKLHNYHWYVKGQQFFTLHTKFEELYTEAALHIDELAERLLTLGGQPVATMTDCLELASIKEAEGNLTAEQMVESTVEDFAQMIEELKLGMKLAESADDEITGDMFLAIHSTLEKHAWMLNSFLGK